TEKIAWRSADQRKNPEPAVFGARAPHLRAIARESNGAQRPPGVADAPLSEVCEAAAVGLNQPDIRAAAVVGDKGDEFSVRGDGGVGFRTFEVGESSKLSIGKRVLNDERAPSRVIP